MAAGDGLKPEGTPLVLTLEMDGGAFAELDALRRRFNLPERNFVPAHVTLFYRLPDERRREIKAFLTQVVAGRRPMEVAVAGVKTTERGVAVFLQSPQLAALRQLLASEWRPWLVGQDLSRFQPHVTIQSNVAESTAQQTRRSVEAALTLKELRGIGLHLWRYRGGPWEDVQIFRFR